MFWFPCSAQVTSGMLEKDGCPLGNGRSTVSRVLFQRRELTEPHWVLGQTRWVLRKKTRWVRFAPQGTHWALSQDSVRANKRTDLKPYSPKPYSARLRSLLLSVHQCVPAVLAELSCADFIFYRLAGLPQPSLTVILLKASWHNKGVSHRFEGLLTSLKMYRCNVGYRSNIVGISRAMGPLSNRTVFTRNVPIICKATLCNACSYRHVKGLVREPEFLGRAKSPIDASVQRMRSTLAGHSAGPCGANTTPTNANRVTRIAAQRTQGLRGPNSVGLGGDMTAKEC